MMLTTATLQLRPLCRPGGASSKPSQALLRRAVVLQASEVRQGQGHGQGAARMDPPFQQLDLEGGLQLAAARPSPALLLPPPAEGR